MATESPFHAWSSDIMNTMLGRSAAVTVAAIRIPNAMGEMKCCMVLRRNAGPGRLGASPADCVLRLIAGLMRWIAGQVGAFGFYRAGGLWRALSVPRC